MTSIFNSFKKMSFFGNNKKNNQIKTNQSLSQNQSNQTNNYTKNQFKKNNSVKTKKDKYTVINYPRKNQTFGEFTGSSPKRAAHKAFSKLAKLGNLRNNTDELLVFSIQNLRTNKIYKYIGKRIKLTEPREVIRNGKKIIYKYVNTVGKYKKELNMIK